MHEFVVDVTAATSWADFIAAFNEGFVRRVGGQWNGNLDAFHDYLFWPDEKSFRLIIRGWDRCSASVNEQSTWDGRPILDVIEEIFRDNPHVEIHRA